MGGRGKEGLEKAGRMVDAGPLARGREEQRSLMEDNWLK